MFKNPVSSHKKNIFKPAIDNQESLKLSLAAKQKL